MPRLEYFIVSESISTDQTTNRLSLFNIIEDLKLPLPATLPRVVATSAWNIQSEERGEDFQVILRIRKPGGEVLEMHGDTAINFTAERSRQRIHHELRGLPLTEPGDWVFEILLNSQHQASHILTVNPWDPASE